ncbi:TnsD family Tn7-like transposition protein [Petroclostridium sp. X23]|uniref:TnsD family Tn7-like transposition protein n=1 Tax=Petroclostridium sp. X23 TaxID=3045146 RepID=UPI0024AE5958|nr:TnsD family Tn7-like transposition protein [Petroclostridium sp. X23]WHH60981.1 TnsD family Tn7-like transposition protein [Petroclostridium sp. X23]
MLGHFLEIYPNEIFYSICVRYHNLTGQKNYQGTAKELFDKKHSGRGLFFPSNISVFTDVMNQSMGKNCMNAIDIINNNTIFPLIKPFISKQQKIRLMSSLLSGIPKICGIADLLAIPENDKGVIKFCNKCMKKFLKEREEGYLNRLHQVPGNDFCLIHNNVLSRYEKSNKSGKIINILNIDCDSHVPEKVSKSLQEEKRNFSVDIEYIMTNKLRDESIEIIRKRYIERLAELGFYKIFEFMDYKRLYDVYINFFSKEFLNDIGFYDSDKDYNSWVQDIPFIKKQSSPIRHLLFIRLLFGSAKAFFEDLSL